MTATISGLHHITAISGKAQHNLNFYVNVLGLRLVKKTVNFDDPSAYHLYYGDEVGTPGTVLTFFPWEHMRRGRRGVGEASLTQFSIPPGSLPFWRERLERAGAPVAGPSAVFGEERLVFEDPDGMKAALVVAADRDERTPWTTTEIGEESAIRGFHGVTLSLADQTATAEFLTGAARLRGSRQGGQHLRYAMPPTRLPGSWTSSSCRAARPALQGGGSVHHIAFSVTDRAAQAEVRDRLVHAGYQVTPQIDRNYFFSIYFRSPGGVLFEVATEEPGFTVDEPVAELGRNLKLPQQHEPLRAEIERALPPLVV